jgi:hypothetical protein
LGGRIRKHGRVGTWRGISEGGGGEENYESSAHRLINAQLALDRECER